MSPKNIGHALSEGLVGGFAAFLRALVSVFAVWLVLHNGLSPLVSFICKAWSPSMGFHWGVAEIGLTIVLGYGAFMDGLGRATLRGIGGVPRAFIEHAGATLFGLLGGGLAIVALELFLFLIFGITFKWDWERITTDPGLTGAMRYVAPAAFFLGTWFAASVVKHRLVKG